MHLQLSKISHPKQTTRTVKLENTVPVKVNQSEIVHTSSPTGPTLNHTSTSTTAVTTTILQRQLPTTTSLNKPLLEQTIPLIATSLDAAQTQLLYQQTPTYDSRLETKQQHNFPTPTQLTPQPATRQNDPDWVNDAEQEPISFREPQTSSNLHNESYTNAALPAEVDNIFHLDLDANQCQLCFKLSTKNHRLPQLTLQIGGTPARFLLDTGAAISLLQKSFLKSTYAEPCSGNPKAIHAANGTHIPILGHAIASLLINGQLYKHQFHIANISRNII